MGSVMAVGGVDLRVRVLLPVHPLPQPYFRDIKQAEPHIASMATLQMRNYVRALKRKFCQKVRPCCGCQLLVSTERS